MQASLRCIPGRSVPQVAFPRLDAVRGDGIDEAEFADGAGNHVDKKKILYVHIGHYKTGSSAIQDYCSARAAELGQHGYLYPASARPQRNPTNHGHLSLSVARNHGFAPPPWYGENVSADEAWGALATEIDASPHRNVILSSEEFVQLALRKDHEAAIGELAQRLAPYDARILFYMREPLSLLKSWYNEVNKGPSGTRNFPTFFAALNLNFLAQGAIWSRFAKAFGRENMITRVYGDIGQAHIAGFMQAIGCAHEPAEPCGLVQTAQPLDALEKRRLANSKLPFEAASFSHIKDIKAFRNRARQISREYDAIARQAGLSDRSALTAASVFAHYARLLSPTLPEGRINQQEVDNLRDMAFAIEETDLPLARELLEIAHMLRPDGLLISKHLESYRSRLEANS